MALLRVLPNPRRQWQRLGFLVPLLQRAAAREISDYGSLGKTLVDRVSSKVRVRLTDELRNYATIVLTGTAHAARRRAIQDGGSSGVAALEIQDYFLSDSRLPSCRGRLDFEAWKRYPPLAVGLGMLRPKPGSLLMRGLALLAADGQGDKAWNPEDAVLDPGGPNPLLLTTAQKVILLYALVDADADILRPLYAGTLLGTHQFSEREAGNALPGIFRSVASATLAKVRSADDRERLAQLQSAAQRIEAVSAKPNPGGKNIREATVTVRLEPYVDLGLLSKVDPFAYSYVCGKPAQLFFGELAGAASADDFMDRQVVGAYARATGLAARPPAPLAAAEVLRWAYVQLKSPLGYASLTDTCLLAAAHALDQDQGCMEVGGLLEMLKRARSQAPQKITFAIDRTGRIASFKMQCSPELLAAHWS